MNIWWPLPLPKPRIGGGISEKAKPSCSPAIFWLISALISAALRWRLLAGSSGRNTTPVLGGLVNCSAFRPGNAIECATPSELIEMQAHLERDASVRRARSAGGCPGGRDSGTEGE